MVDYSGGNCYEYNTTIQQMQRIATSKPKMGLSGYGKVGNTPYSGPSNSLLDEGNGG